MVDIKIPATDSHHRFSQRIWCFEPSQVLTGFYSSVFQIPDCQVICCLESWTRTVAAQRSRRRQHFFWPWEMEMDIACQSMLYRTNYDQPPFYKDFRTCWYKGRPPCEPRMSCHKGSDFICQDFFLDTLLRAHRLRMPPWTTLKVSQYFHAFSHHCSYNYTTIDTLCINMIEERIIGFDHGFRIWQFDKSC